MSRLFGFLLIVVAVVACVGLAGSVVDNVTPQTTQGEEIKMIQPSGWWLSRDAYAAQEVNVPNSEANKNNGDMHLANAQATLAVEKANALRAEAERLNNQQFQQGKTNGVVLGGIVGACFGGILLVVGIVALATLFSKAGSGGTG